MFAGDFYQKLKKLNKNLVIFGKDERYAAGLYLYVYGEFIHICGVDWNELPERTVTDEKGHIILGGWRRVLKILIQKQLVNLYKAEKVFQTNLRHGLRKINVALDPTIQVLTEIMNRREAKDGTSVLTRQDYMDFRDALKYIRR